MATVFAVFLCLKLTLLACRSALLRKELRHRAQSFTDGETRKRTASRCLGQRIAGTMRHGFERHHLSKCVPGITFSE